MRRKTRHVKFDKNHKQIVDDLRGQGVEVVEIMEPVDVILRDRDGYVSFCEIKVEGQEGQFMRSQIKFLSETKCPAFVARNADEALHKLKSRSTLSQKAKDELAAVLIKKPDSEKFSPGPIHRILEG
jgi:hypothetical protein